MIDVQKGDSPPSPEEGVGFKAVALVEAFLEAASDRSKQGGCTGLLLSPSFQAFARVSVLGGRIQFKGTGLPHRLTLSHQGPRPALV